MQLLVWQVAAAAWGGGMRTASVRWSVACVPGMTNPTHRESKNASLDVCWVRGTRFVPRGTTRIP